MRVRHAGPPLPALAAIGFGAGAVAVALRHGPGMSPDSVAYMSTLRVFEETGVLSFSPLWPPAYPFVVALVGTGRGLLALNVLAVAAHLYLVHALAVTVLRAQRPAALSLALVATSTGLVVTHAMLWSEPLFMLCVDLSVLALVHLARDGWDPRWVALLIISANGAGMFRYSAIALYLTIGIALLTTCRGQGPRHVVRCASIALACAAATVIVALTNIARGWDALGPRLPSQYDLGEVMLQLPAATSLHLTGGLSRSVPLGLLALVLLGAAMTVWLLGSRPSLRREPATVLLIWVMVAVGFLLLSEARTNIDPLDFRLLAPVVPAFVILVVHVARALLRPRWAAIAGWSTLGYCGIAAALSLMWATHVGPWTVYVVPDPAQDSRIDAAVDRVVPQGTPIVSDAPWRTVLSTRRDQVVGFPDAGPWPGDRPYWVYGSSLPRAKEGDVAVVFDPSVRPEPRWRLIGRDGTVRIFEVRPE